MGKTSGAVAEAEAFLACSVRLGLGGACPTSVLEFAPQLLMLYPDAAIIEKSKEFSLFCKDGPSSYV